MAETWPVVTSPMTGCDKATTNGDIHWDDIDVDDILAAIRRRLVYPAPIRDKALEDR